MMNYSLAKIIATIGPTCENKEKIQQLIKKGVNIFRFNLKHNTLEWHRNKIKLVRKISKSLKIPIGILIDLKGGELRTGNFEGKAFLELKKGETIIFAKKDEKSIYKIIPIPKIKNFFRFTTGQMIFVDDGKFQFKVEKITNKKVFAKVIEGGKLGERKTITLTDFHIKSKVNLREILPVLKLCLDLGVDFIGLSFVRSKNEVLKYKEFFKTHKNHPWIISKIEAKEAVENLDEILDVSDGIIVARGDLGVEISFEKVPLYQKKIIKKCLIKGKPIIVATHLLESMIENSQPTRAEVSDVANTLYDFSDGLLLSAETAYGKNPDSAVAILRKIANFVESQKPEIKNFPFEVKTQTQAICLGAYHLYKSEFCQKQNIKAFAVLSKTGKTALSLSRLRPYLPIFVLTENKSLVEKLTIVFGVHPLYLPLKNIYQIKGEREIKIILNSLKEKTFLKRGDKIILIYGEDWGTKPGKTSIMRVQEVV